MTAAADTEKDGQRDDGNAGDASYDTTDDGTDNGRTAPSGKANLIALGTVGVPNLESAKNDP